MAPSFFKDFGKPAKDVLSKNYDFDNKKVEVSSSSGDVEFSAEWSAKAAAKVESVFSLPRQGQLTVESDVANKVTGTLKTKNIVPGGTLKTKASTKGNVFVGFEYLKDFGAFSVDVDHSQKATIVNASALLQQSCFLLGGCAQFDANQSDINEYSLGLGYVEKGVFEATAKLTDQPNKAGSEPSLLLQFVHHASPKLTYSSMFSRSISDSPKSSCEFGGVYALNADTKIGLKINNSAQLGMYALHQLNKQVSLSHSLRLDANDPSAPHGYGMGLKFKL